jgi:hypothetical protein
VCGTSLCILLVISQFVAQYKELGLFLICVQFLHSLQQYRSKCSQNLFASTRYVQPYNVMVTNPVCPWTISYAFEEYFSTLFSYKKTPERCAYTISRWSEVSEILTTVFEFHMIRSIVFNVRVIMNVNGVERNGRGIFENHLWICSDRRRKTMTPEIMTSSGPIFRTLMFSSLYCPVKMEAWKWVSSPETGYFDRGFSRFSSVSAGKCRDSTLN